MPPRAPTFQQQYPLLHALASNNAARAAKLCTPTEAVKCGPGNLSALMLALVLDADQLLPQLLSAGAPLDARLGLGYRDSQLSSWLETAGLAGSRCRKLLEAGHTALDLALVLDKVEQACLLVGAGADLDGLLLLRTRSISGRTEYPQVAQHALAYYTKARLATASPRVLCQVARLAMLAGAGATACLRVLQLAARHNLAFGHEHAEQLVALAAKVPCYALAAQLVQRSPNRVWPLLLANMHVGSKSYTTLPASVAAKLGPLLAKLFAEGRLTLPQPASQHLAALLYTAVKAGNESPCLSVLRTAEQQQVACSPDFSFDLLRKAGARDYAQVAMVLLRQHWDSLWTLLRPEWGERRLNRYVQPQLAEVLFPHLLQRVQSGQLKLEDGAQLVLLLRYTLTHNQPTTCLALLQAASAQGVQLSAEQADTALRLAATLGQLDVVVHFMRAGVSVSLEAIHVAIEVLSIPCLAVLLQHGSPPQVDRTARYLPREFADHYYHKCWTCPILRTLQDSYRRCDTPDDDCAVKALGVLEVLLGAGYTPATYDIKTRNGTLRELDPLREDPDKFAVTGCNRCCGWPFPQVDPCHAPHVPREAEGHLQDCPAGRGS